MTWDGATTFPGFGEDAPLELSNLPAAVEAGLLRRLRDGTFDAWADTAATVGYCARPVRLTGQSTTIDTLTGEVLGSFSSTDAPLGVLYRPAGTGGPTCAPPARGSTPGTRSR